MPYTVWSRGRLLGETELDYVRCVHMHRSGDFHPTEFGHRVMPAVTDPRVAVIELGKIICAAPLDDDVECSDARRSTNPQRATAEADLASATNRLEAMALELRDPNGTVIPTEWIDIRDTEFSLALAAEMKEEDLFDESSSELDAEIEDDIDWVEEEAAADFLSFDEPRPWKPERGLARYQIHVALLDDASVP